MGCELSIQLVYIIDAGRICLGGVYLPKGSGNLKLAFDDMALVRPKPFFFPRVEGQVFYVEPVEHIDWLDAVNDRPQEDEKFFATLLRVERWIIEQVFQPRGNL